MIDWNIRFGDVLVIVSLAGTAVIYAFRSGKFAESINNMQKEITELKGIAKSTAEVLVTVAVQTTKINSLQDQYMMLHRTVEDLRRGNGFVHGRSGIDGEYK